MKRNKLVLALLATLSLVSVAMADPVDYGATLTTNLTTINTIWGSVATIIIGVALVKVGAKFFRKAG